MNVLYQTRRYIALNLSSYIILIKWLCIYIPCGCIYLDNRTMSIYLWTLLLPSICKNGVDSRSRRDKIFWNTDATEFDQQQSIIAAFFADIVSEIVHFNVKLCCIQRRPLINVLLAFAKYSSTMYYIMLYYIYSKVQPWRLSTIETCPSVKPFSKVELLYDSSVRSVKPTGTISHFTGKSVKMFSITTQKEAVLGIIYI